jgi:predicted nucleic acid-binding protein
MRVVLDTNVLVSGIFFTGPPATILAAWASRRFELVASVEVLAEYRRVGARLGSRSRWWMPNPFSIL